MSKLLITLLITRKNYVYDNIFKRCNLFLDVSFELVLFHGSYLMSYSYSFIFNFPAIFVFFSTCYITKMIIIFVMTINQTPAFKSAIYFLFQCYSTYLDFYCFIDLPVVVGIINITHRKE